MKLCILILIVILFGLIGYFFKNKYVLEKNMLVYLKDFANYYYVNINIFKNDLNKIIESYLIMQNNKNANFNKLFIKINKNYSINEKIIDIYINDESIKQNCKIFMQGLGKNKTQIEIQNIEKMIEFYENNINITQNNIKNKGDLLFKIWLAIGVCLSVLLW